MLALAAKFQAETVLREVQEVPNIVVFMCQTVVSNMCQTWFAWFFSIFHPFVNQRFNRSMLFHGPRKRGSKANWMEPWRFDTENRHVAKISPPVFRENRHSVTQRSTAA